MKPRPLAPGQAARTVLARITPAIDQARQIATNVGARPYLVFLVWGQWGGKVRGEGDFRELARLQLLPNPLTESVQFQRNPYSAGVLPVGSVRVSQISTSYSQRLLTGEQFPNGQDFDLQNRRSEFYFEIVQDDRSAVENPERARMRLLAGPVLKPTRVSWELILERASADRSNREAAQDRHLGRRC